MIRTPAQTGLIQEKLVIHKIIAITEARSISCPDLTAKYSVGMKMWDVV